MTIVADFNIIKKNYQRNAVTGRSTRIPEAKREDGRCEFS